MGRLVFEQIVRLRQGGGEQLYAAMRRQVGGQPGALVLLGQDLLEARRSRCGNPESEAQRALTALASVPTSREERRKVISSFRAAYSEQCGRSAQQLVARWGCPSPRTKKRSNPVRGHWWYAFD